MKKATLVLVLALVLLPLSLWGAVTLFSAQLTNMVLKPDHRRHEDPITVPPDYTDDRYWASLPGGAGRANLVPEGQQARSGSASVAVFYIHPTSYLSGDRWNSPLFEDSWAWEMVDRMMASQASAFNACCDVYAPHYREATLWSFVEREHEDGLHALNIAYVDVSRAFDNFIQRIGRNTPFIVASHSQGTAHALRLLSERVNNGILRERLVAAYLIGYEVPMDMFERELGNIPPCENATDNGCVVHWAVYGDQGTPEPGAPHWYSSGWEYSRGKEYLCTNPLSWRRDEDRVPATEHPGALPTSSGYSFANFFFNSPSGKKVLALPAVLPAWTWAQCRNGFLYVEPQIEGPFASPLDDETQNYHTRDYALFYQAIRDNAVLRARQKIVLPVPFQ
ncbi:MAG: DUF3089 domain-containing protein [Halioglobus sp.]|nr:DUF3089 domain-containing protein [Halioglobus sp.]